MSTHSPSPSPSSLDSPPAISPALFERVATAPISWGVCEVPGWGLQLPVERVLGEMSALGFTHTELGSAGWLPTEPVALQETLAPHRLSLLAAFIPLVLHDPDRYQAALADAHRWASILAAAGARYFNTAAVTSADWEPRTPLDDAQWAHLFRALDELDELCAGYGLHQVVHSHVGCVIETRDEVDAILDNSGADIVLDTGHLAVGGHDPVELAAKRTDRIGLVHLKDLRHDEAAALNAGETSLMEAVQRGLFPHLGGGELALDRVVANLEGNGYEGWYVIEQDCAIDPADTDGPGPQAEVQASLAYLDAIFPLDPPRGEAS